MSTDGETRFASFKVNDINLTSGELSIVNI